MKDRTTGRRGRAVRAAAFAMAALLPLAALVPAAATQDGKVNEGKAAMERGHAAPSMQAGARALVAVAGGPEVNVTNFQFQPAVLTVRAGTRVTWINRDTTPHTVTSRDARFTSSAGMDTDDRHAVVFDRPGTYEYFCSLHPMMVGKVVVEPGG